MLAGEVQRVTRLAALHRLHRRTLAFALPGSARAQSLSFAPPRSMSGMIAPRPPVAQPSATAATPRPAAFWKIRTHFRVLESAFDVDRPAQRGEAEAFRLRHELQIERLVDEIDAAGAGDDRLAGVEHERLHLEVAVDAFQVRRPCSAPEAACRRSAAPGIAFATSRLMSRTRSSLTEPPSIITAASPSASPSIFATELPSVSSLRAAGDHARVRLARA